jgi:hypothetical protein
MRHILTLVARVSASLAKTSTLKILYNVANVGKQGILVFWWKNGVGVAT